MLVDFLDRNFAEKKWEISAKIRITIPHFYPAMTEGHFAGPYSLFSKFSIKVDMPIFTGQLVRQRPQPTHPLIPVSW